MVVCCGKGNFVVSLDKAISCFFSVLRQFKIVKRTRQPGEKNKQNCLCMLFVCQT
jgi:hypothetical protein